ncbi:phospholipase carboxylesterase [Colletotrichum karsti]|uniref:Phospholipase carboxylesterase n=1 Tax=Colletotrichum karsti TaxID=1095194 RepID=A0A9P6I0S2_9PEZI|nr:phospholipase carboxylesterase [Colletotrichum karsti]KAF9874353.1 phospholipase carboxylesterase [Colletotrichum karsti]
MGFTSCTVGPVVGSIHTHTVILLHGRDSECHEFGAEFFESETSGSPQSLKDLFPNFKWVFPGARPIPSERFDTPLSQWFDMWSVENPDQRPELQQPGLSDSVQFVLDIVEQESAYVPRNKIWLGGISQGFATAVAAFVCGGGGFAGLIGSSSWALPALSSIRLDGDSSVDETYRRLQEAFSPELHVGSTMTVWRTTPVFLSHSVDDDVVPVENGRVLRDCLSEVLGTEVEWHEYESGGHWFNEPQGIDDLASFFSRTMGGPLR